MFEIIRRKIRKRVLRWAANDVLMFVTAEDVLQIANGRVFAGGRELRPDEILKLVEEATFFQKSALFHYLVKLLVYGTQERILRDGADEYDLWTARASRLMSAQLFEALNDISTIDKAEVISNLTT